MGASRERSEKAGCTDVPNTSGGVKEGFELGYSASQLNLLALPSLPLSDRKVLPKKLSAIYFVLSESNEILYIGRAICLYNRWNRWEHHKQSQLDRLVNIRIAWMEVNNRALLPRVEYALIKYFSPPLNLINNALIPTKGLGQSPRKHEIKVRLNDQELKILRAEAKRRDVSVSEIIRDYLKTLSREAQAS